MVEIFTDGCSRGNPGPGGFCTILKYKDKEKIIKKGFKLTTNNRMELLSVIYGLSEIKNEKFPITIYSDSKYVIDAINKGWLESWQKKNFKGKKNVDLWKKFIKVSKNLSLTFIWVKGHSGHIENEKCDAIAKNCSMEQNLSEDIGYIR